MVKEEYVNNPVLKLSDEHKIITDYLVMLNGLLKNRNLVEAIHQMESVEAKFMRDLGDHFEFEEQAFFPGALLGNLGLENIRLVLGLQRDHGVILSELGFLYSLLPLFKNMGQPFSEAFFDRLARFTERIKVHIKRELEEFFPSIHGNQKCKTFVKNLLLKD